MGKIQLRKKEIHFKEYYRGQQLLHRLEHQKPAVVVTDDLRYMRRSSIFLHQQHFGWRSGASTGLSGLLVPKRRLRDRLHMEPAISQTGETAACFASQLRWYCEFYGRDDLAAIVPTWRKAVRLSSGAAKELLDKFGELGKTVVDHDLPGYREWLPDVWPQGAPYPINLEPTFNASDHANTDAYYARTMRKSIELTMAITWRDTPITEPRVLYHIPLLGRYEVRDMSGRRIEIVTTDPALPNLRSKRGFMPFDRTAPGAFTPHDPADPALYPWQHINAAQWLKTATGTA